MPSHPSLPLYDLLVQLNTEINSILPHTLPKQIHVDFIESCVERILAHYSILITSGSLHQTQALQFLFDVKFVTTLCVPRENVQLVAKSQVLCENLRSKIDPFDLDVFYGYLQNNVQKCVFQSQVLICFRYFFLFTVALFLDVVRLLNTINRSISEYWCARKK